jgi:hypothetical protein
MQHLAADHADVVEVPDDDVACVLAGIAARAVGAACLVGAGVEAHWPFEHRRMMVVAGSQDAADPRPYERPQALLRWSA